MRGATVWNYNNPKYISISIHAPHAGSDLLLVGCRYKLLISIHAPHAGSDLPCGLQYLDQRNFNPRSPCGERRPPPKLAEVPIAFQSTLPMRGATIRNLLIKWTTDISIHAPHAGSDTSSTDFWTFAVLFQSTLPMRGATSQKVVFFYGRINFNPRSPCGERLS